METRHLARLQGIFDSDQKRHHKKPPPVHDDRTTYRIRASATVDPVSHRNFSGDRLGGLRAWFLVDGTYRTYPGVRPAVLSSSAATACPGTTCGGCSTTGTAPRCVCRGSASLLRPQALMMPSEY